MEYKSFLPPKRVLMGPGPSNIHPRVLEAQSRLTIGHLDPKFVELMDEIKALLQYAFQTDNEVTFPVSAPGSTGMETCLVNLIEPGEQVAVCVNGVFGGRMKSIIERCGGIPIVIEDEWGTAVTTSKVEQTLAQNPEVKILAFVHAETSTGARSDAKIISEIGKKYNCLIVADTVTSLGGSELKVDEWNLDAVYSGTQKCLSCPPGLSPVTFSKAAIDKIKNRKTPVQSWFMDVNLVLGYWGGGAKRSYHHTAPINSLYGLHEALILIKEEGIENSWNRHRLNGDLFCKAAETIGLNPYVKEEERLSQLIAISIPEGVDDAEVRSKLLSDYSLEIGAGLGSLAGKVWRIGLMGYSSNKSNIEFCISALRNVMSR
ncbi:MAG: alanine--glyoxylate aminotransferase family protein [Melioribacteraceae bacterium]|nr:alanine--glyoxylate aminotransferase family protein [Melioribacteraceae bacterium]MCF8431111.1 alanine--glyoxylate aminotransferase family protein [Melioribacteraceae bacterium]